MDSWLVFWVKRICLLWNLALNQFCIFICNWIVNDFWSYDQILLWSSETWWESNGHQSSDQLSNVPPFTNHVIRFWRNWINKGKTICIQLHDVVVKNIILMLEEWLFVVIYWNNSYSSLISHLILINSY